VRRLTGTSGAAYTAVQAAAVEAIERAVITVREGLGYLEKRRSMLD
jgi:hypothetical protein